MRRAAALFSLGERIEDLPLRLRKRIKITDFNRAMRGVSLAIKGNRAASAHALLKASHKAFLIRVSKLLTNNGKEFTERFFICREHQPVGNDECKERGIEQQRTKPRTRGPMARSNSLMTALPMSLRRTGSPAARTWSRPCCVMWRCKATNCPVSAGEKDA